MSIRNTAKLLADIKQRDEQIETQANTILTLNRRNAAQHRAIQGLEKRLAGAAYEKPLRAPQRLISKQEASS